MPCHKFHECLDGGLQCQGLAIEPHNDALKNGLRQAEDAASGDDGGAGIGGMFSSPDFLAKLAMNPETRDLVSKPDFMMKLNMIQRNPSSLGQFLQDPDIMKVRGLTLI